MTQKTSLLNLFNSYELNNNFILQAAPLFELKKIISSFVTIPGIFIVCLILLGIYGFRKREKIFLINILFGVILYLFSITCVADFFIGNVEENHSYDGKTKADIIILLGGGLIRGVDDISGKSIPSYDMTVRLVDAVRLYNKYRLPVIVSGGSVGSNDKEAVIVRRFLIDLGVQAGDIIIEERSRDTVENARYVKEIFQELGLKRGLLLTSAYHIRRAKYLFNKTGLDVIPFSSGPLSEKEQSYNLYDFLPSINNLSKTAIALSETIGMIFYYFKYEIF